MGEVEERKGGDFNLVEEEQRGLQQASGRRGGSSWGRGRDHNWGQSLKYS